MKRIKMIWDFRGPNALKTAQHHEIHLKDYLKTNPLNFQLTGVEEVSPVIAAAYLVVEETEVNTLRKRLKPHRGQYYEQ